MTRTKKKADSVEWAALTTWVEERSGGDRLIEQGRVYARKPARKDREGCRKLEPDEPTVACPRCGQRFVSVDDIPAEELRDLHITGDADAPSICPGREISFEVEAHRD